MVLVAMVAGNHPAPLPAEFAASPGFYWSILLLDLGVVVPATVVTGIALLRGGRCAVTALFAIIAWYALVPVSVAAMSVVMLANGDPNASAGQSWILCSVALVFAGLAAWILQPVLRSRKPATATRLPRASTSTATRSAYGPHPEQAVRGGG